MPMLRFVAGVAVAAALMAGHAAQADSFDARPITIETRDGLAMIVVTNPGDHRIYLEGQVLEWTQDATGTERTPESESAIASPPAMWVPPHSNYTMRVRLPGGNQIERAYRVIIRQLPERSDITGGRIVFALTQNLPAFVIPASPAPPTLSARLVDARHVLFQNTGGRRVRLTGVIQDGRTLASGLLGYALAQGAIVAPLGQPAHPGTIDVETDLGRRSIALR